MKHDEKWLYGTDKSDGPYIADDDCIVFAKKYAEHISAKLQSRVDELESQLDYVIDVANDGGYCPPVSFEDAMKMYEEDQEQGK